MRRVVGSGEKRGSADGAKRYRPLLGDFDARVSTLELEIQEDWDKEIKEQWLRNKANIRRQLALEYGEYDFDAKLKNYIEMGPKPFSVLAYHNHFLDQARTAFVMGAYYPALAAVCALGERMLNHLMLGLRESFRSSPHYRNVYRKNSFDQWSKMIDPLEDWNVLLSDVAADFRLLAAKRNESIHFRQELDQDARGPALEAIQLLQRIVSNQFPSLGNQPWFIPNTSGASYISLEAEQSPFVQLVYIPNSFLVSIAHEVVFTHSGILVIDEHPGSGRNLTDVEFAQGER
ncbi:hypothetical protein [Micromonospora aurantiaca (nom. illeg.)]|uniref:hypothetical protein n=1 Tax=Micromonospora aurantiaca (nom. illeg.) TaxID=47850 RepID=UPI0034066327